MADNVAITEGSGVTISSEEVTTLNAGAVSAQQVQRVAISSRTANGTAIDLIGSTADGLLVNLGSNNDVTVTGTATVSGTVTANAGTGTMAVSIATNTPVGNIAHDSADSGAPLKFGAKAETALSGVTLVADGDRTDLYAGVDGVLITRPHANLEDIVSGVSTITDGSSTSTIGAQGSGIKVYLTSVIIANSSSTNVTVDLRDGTAGSVKATFPVPANGGVVHTLNVPLGFSANTIVAADPSASATSIVTTLIGFKSKV